MVDLYTRTYIFSSYDIFFKSNASNDCTVNLGIKELFDKEQIGIKEPFPVTKCQFTS